MLTRIRALVAQQIVSQKKKTPCDAFTNLTVSDDTAAFDIYDAVSKVNPTHLKWNIPQLVESEIEIIATTNQNWN